MKKIIAMLMTMVLIVLLGACSSDQQNASQLPANTEATENIKEKSEPKYQLVERVDEDKANGYVWTSRYEYDEKGKILSEWMDGYVNGDTGIEKGSTLQEYHYGVDGTLETIIYYQNGIEKEREAIECDEKGNIIKRTDKDGNVTAYSYDANGRLEEKSFKDFLWTYKYDERGNLVEESSVGYWKIQYEYDESGRRKSVTREYYQSNSVLYGKADPTYSGNVEVIIWYDERLMETGHTKFTYDDAGNLIEQAEYKVDYDVDKLVYLTTYKYIKITD